MIYWHASKTYTNKHIYNMLNIRTISEYMIYSLVLEEWLLAGCKHNDKKACQCSHVRETAHYLFICTYSIT